MTPPIKELPSQVSGEENRHDRFLKTDHLRTDLSARSFRGGVVTLTAQAMRFLLGISSTAILARLLRPQDFGLVAMVTSITSFVGLFRDLGLSNATVQRSEVTHAQVSLLFWINVALSVVVTLIVLAIAPLIAWFYHEPRLVLITSVLAMTFIFSGLTAQHQALLRRQMQFRSLAVRDVVAMACGITVGITLAWFGYGYWSLVAIPVVANIAGCILLWTICDWRPTAFRRRVGARAMIAFGGNLTAFNLVNYFTLNFDNILIGRVLGSAPLGIYTKAYGLLTLPIAQINKPMASVMLPGLSRLQNDPAEYARLFVNAVRAIGLVTIPIVGLCFFLSHDIVWVLLGRKWLAVAPVFQLLAPAALFGAIAFAPGWLCQSLGRARRQLHYALVSAPVCVVGFLIGIKWGVSGVALSYSIAFSCCFWGYMWYATKDSPVRFSEIAMSFMSAVLPTLLAGAVVWTLRHWLLAGFRPFVALIVLGLVFSLIYIAGVAMTGENRVLIRAGIASIVKFRTKERFS